MKKLTLTSHFFGLAFHSVLTCLKGYISSLFLPPTFCLLDFFFSLLLFCFLHGFFLYLFCFFLVFFHSFDHGFLFLPSFSVVLASLVGHYNLLHFGCWIDCCASHVCSVSSSVDHFCSLGHCWAGDVLQHWMWLPIN